MFDLAAYPMGLYGAFAAMFVYFVFIGTWWLYAVRVEEAKRLQPAHAY